MTLIEFGNVLREERVRCGHTVDEVASRLKITSRMVRAIENGDIDSMPHAVYARGFIRAYGRLLDIDEEEVRLVCVTLRDEDEQSAPELLKPPRSGRSAPIGCLIRIVVLCLVLGGIWVFRDALPFEGVKLWIYDLIGQGSEVMQEERTQPEESAPAASPVMRQENATSRNETDFIVPDTSVNATRMTASTADPKILTDALPQSQNSLGGTQSEASPVTTSGFSTPLTPAESGNLTLQTDAGGTPLVADPAQRKHQVIITAVAECWIHSTADGTETRQLSIRTGEVFSLSFDRKLAVKLGNAGGVRIKYDGKDVPPPGTLGQVRTITFPPQETN